LLIAGVVACRHGSKYIGYTSSLLFRFAENGSRHCGTRVDPITGSLPATNSEVMHSVVEVVARGRSHNRIEYRAEVSPQRPRRRERIRKSLDQLGITRRFVSIYGPVAGLFYMHTTVSLSTIAGN